MRAKIEFRNDQGEKFIFSIDEAKEIYKMLHEWFGESAKFGYVQVPIGDSSKLFGNEDLVDCVSKTEVKPHNPDFKHQ